MSKQESRSQISSDEWVGRLMTSSQPDPFLYDLVVGGAARREAHERHEALIDAAYTPEAKAWNRLSDMTVTGREVIVYIPAPISWSRAFSSPDEEFVREPTDFLFRRRQLRGALCEQWELVSAQ